MFWPWTTKRKREADNEDESAQEDLRDLQWPDLISTALRRTATGDTSSREVATAAVNVLEPRMRFFQKLSQEERKLDASTRNERIVDAYELLSKTSTLPMQSGVRRGAFEALTQRRRRSSCPTVSCVGYNVEEESKELAEFLKRQSPALKKELAKLKLWNKFDVFNLDKVSSNRSLYFVTLAILDELDLFRTFRIPLATFNNFMRAVEEGYKWSNNTYHNDIHAADVTHTSFLFLSGGLHHALPPIEQLALILAAVVHDLGHPGVNNDFLIKIGSDAAFSHNDQSVNENVHLTNAFSLLRHEDKNILVNFTQRDAAKLRELIIGMVLATDMARHHDVVGMYEKCVERSGSNLTAWPERDRRLALQLTLHCADIGNQTKPFDQSSQWTSRVMEEFFSQGDLERKLNMPVSATCDRSSVVVANAQMFFIDVVVRPALKIFFGLTNECEDVCLRNLDTCQQRWAAEVARVTDGDQDADGMVRGGGAGSGGIGVGAGGGGRKKSILRVPGVADEYKNGVKEDDQAGGIRTFMSPTAAAYLEAATTETTSSTLHPGESKRKRRKKKT